jgi:hypothetical protein
MDLPQEISSDWKSFALVLTPSSKVRDVIYSFIAMDDVRTLRRRPIIISLSLDSDL